MTAHTPIAAAETGLEREIREIGDLMAALEKRRHWLMHAQDWQRARKSAYSPDQRNSCERFYCNAMKQADHYQADILTAAHALLEIDAIHDALLELPA